MTSKHPSSDFDHAAELYTGGLAIDKVAKQVGMADVTLIREFRERGILRAAGDLATARNKARRAERFPIAEMAEAYRSGTTELTLAKRYGTSRPTIVHCLADAGVERRTQAQTNQLLMDARSPEERLRNAQAAHESLRGKPPTWDKRCRDAAGRERNQIGISPSAQALQCWLGERGLMFTFEKAVGPYNVDLASFPIAVEVNGGGWHTSRSSDPAKVRYLLDQGWSVEVVWVNQRRYPLRPVAADDIVTFFEQAQRDPAFRRQYRVIRGTGELVAIGCDEIDKVSPVPANRRRPSNGA